GRGRDRAGRDAGRRRDPGAGLHPAVRSGGGPVPLHPAGAGRRRPVSATLPLRVMVPDVWDEVTLDLPPSTPVAELKRLALERSRVRREPDEYVVKFRGAELTDETRTLAESGLVPNAPLIVLPRRRRPVR